MILEILAFLGLAISFALAELYSSKEQWGRMDKYYKLASTKGRLLFGFGWGALCFIVLAFIDRQIIVLGAIGLFILTTILYKDKLKSLWKVALLLGIFLMVFDWVFENIGANLNFWYSYISVFFVRAVPIEIMITCLLGGFSYALFLPKRWNWKYALLISSVFGFGGVMGENTLRSNGFMSYSGGWTPIHAFVAYFSVWFLINLVWYFVLNREKKKK